MDRGWKSYSFSLFFLYTIYLFLYVSLSLLCFCPCVRALASGPEMCFLCAPFRCCWLLLVASPFQQNTEKEIKTFATARSSTRRLSQYDTYTNGRYHVCAQTTARTSLLDYKRGRKESERDKKQLKKVRARQEATGAPGAEEDRQTQENKERKSGGKSHNGHSKPFSPTFFLQTPLFKPRREGEKFPDFLKCKTYRNYGRHPGWASVHHPFKKKRPISY